MQIEEILNEMKASSLTRQVLWVIWKNQRIRPKQLGVLLKEWGGPAVYSRLRKLEQTGLVRATERGKRFSLYELTEQGKKVVESLARECVPPFDSATADQTNSARAIIDLVHTQHAKTKNMLEKWEKAPEEMEKAAAESLKRWEEEILRRWGSDGAAEIKVDVGIAYLRKGLFDDAIAEFQRAIELDPTHAGAHHALGKAYVGKGLFDDAIAEFQRAIELDPTHAGAHHALGEVYVQKGLHDEAIVEFGRSIELEPNLATHHTDMGSVHDEGGTLEPQRAERPATERINELANHLTSSKPVPLPEAKLDKVLHGEIPEGYAVVLTSPSCDERDLLIKRFLEAGVKEGDATFYITNYPCELTWLVKEYQSNFYLFICNPQADAMIESLPNVYKLKGVENLTEINNALTSTIRKRPRAVVMSTHAEDLKLRLMAIELLKTAKYKRNITYRELASETGLPVTVLSRYAKGHVLPNTARAKQLWKVLTRLVGLEPELRSARALKGQRRICIDLISDVLLQHHALQTRSWLAALIPELKSEGFTILAVLNPQMHSQEELQAIMGLFDDEISICEKESGKGPGKYLKIKKMSNHKYLENELPRKTHVERHSEAA